MAPAAARDRTFPASKAVLFDAFGALFNDYRAGWLAERVFPGHGDPLAALARDEPIDACTRLLSMRGGDARGIRAGSRTLLFASSNGGDAIGATWYGYTALCVNRARLPLEQCDAEPTRRGTRLRDVLDFFPV